MASLRGAQALFNGESVASGGTSVIATPGTGPYVCLYIDNTGSASATFEVQVSAVTTPEPGLNALSQDADNQDGGLDWYPLSGSTSLVVAAGAKIAYDLSPFGPQFVRLHCTAGTGTTVKAMISAFGPN